MAESRNSERLRELLDDYRVSGIDAVRSRLHPEIEWHAPPEWLEQKLYRGPDEVAELADFWLGQFEDYRLDVVHTIDIGDGRVAALVLQRGRIKESGAEVEQEAGWLVRFEDGLVRRNDVSFSWAETLEQAGLDPAEHLPSGSGGA